MDAPRRRRLDGWGFEGEGYAPSRSLLAWLMHRLGRPSPFSAFDRSKFAPPLPRDLPDFAGEVSVDPIDRLIHARGQGLTDLLRLRSNTIPSLPDAVLRPRSVDEVEAILAVCASSGVRVIPWGGGTSVTGGVNVVPGAEPVVSLDLERLSGLESFDEVSGLAALAAGTPGPAVESALGARGFTLGHFPQSWERSTVGGWVVTRASGQESLGYGDMADLVAGLDVVAPAGRIVLPAYPSTAAGPDLRQVVCGSEGRLGVVTQVTVRVRPHPEKVEVIGALLPAWDDGLGAVRELVQSAVPLNLIRLSDEPETEVAMAVGISGHPRVASLLRAFLRLRGIERGCLILCGAGGSEGEVDEALHRALSVLRRYRSVGLGKTPGRHWLRDRFRHPYLRDSLLDLGFATDTLETAAPWSRLGALARVVRRALETSLEGENEAVAVLCHVSHPYRDGASLYFTFFYRCPTDPEEAVERWARLKRAATAALVEEGGTVSHHHGVGSWHAPWLAKEMSETGLRALRAMAAALDPAGCLNPHVLLDPADRLGV